MKKLIICMIVALVVGFGGWKLLSKLKSDNDSNPLQATVILNGETHKELSVSLTDIYPGQSASYEIALQATEGKTYKVDIEFCKKEDGLTTLAPFIDVTIKYDGATVKTGKLSDLLSATSGTTLQVEFDGNEAEKVEIVYSMAESVGDEAQGAEAAFNVVLSEKIKYEF